MTNTAEGRDLIFPPSLQRVAHGVQITWMLSSIKHYNSQHVCATLSRREHSSSLRPRSVRIISCVCPTLILLAKWLSYITTQAGGFRYDTRSQAGRSEQVVDCLILPAYPRNHIITCRNAVIPFIINLHIQRMGQDD